MELRYLGALHLTADQGTAEIDRQRKMRKSSFFFVLFMVYPNICNHAFGIFNCRQVGEDLALLTADYRVDCASDTHRLFQPIAIVVIAIVAVGVPLLALAMLFLAAIEESGQEDAAIARRITEECELGEARFMPAMVRHIRLRKNFNFMLDAFRPEMYYWESVYSWMPYAS